MEKLYWCYGNNEDGLQEEGALIEVEIVDLGPVANAELRKLYEQPTNITEIGF